MKTDVLQQSKHMAEETMRCNISVGAKLGVQPANSPEDAPSSILAPLRFLSSHRAFFFGPMSDERIRCHLRRLKRCLWLLQDLPRAVGDVSYRFACNDS